MAGTVSLRTIFKLQEDSDINFDVTETFTNCDESSLHAVTTHLGWQCAMLFSVSTSPSVHDHTSTSITPNVSGSSNHAQQPIH